AMDLSTVRASKSWTHFRVSRWGIQAGLSGLRMRGRGLACGRYGLFQPQRTLRSTEARHLPPECEESAETTRSVYGFRTDAVRPICFHVRCEGRAIHPTRNMKRNARSLRPTRELMKALARLTAVGMTSDTIVAQPD